MPRNLTAGVIAEITARNLRPVLFVQMQFVSTTLYLWSGYGSINWNGQTWIGVGDLGTVSALPENQDVNAEGVQFQLSGIPADLITKALGEVRQGAPVIVYQGFLDPSGAIVSSPANAWSGRMDTCQIDEGYGSGPAETAVITITAESRLRDLNRSRERRFTSQDQAIDFDGDLGFDFVPSLQEANVFWGGGGVPQAAPNTSGGAVGSYSYGLSQGAAQAQNDG